MTGLATKKAALVASLKELKKVTVAFSGGIDSTLVLKMALETLGQSNVTAVVANSELFTDEEFEKAVSLAEELGATVKTTTLDYLSETHIEHNTPDSWYYAKKMFYTRLTEMAQANGSVVLDGLIKNDENDYRPGMKARTEVGARSLLEEADFYKVDVRALSQELGLTNWNKVASCSVASRFPYGTTLTHENVAQVMAAESYLRGLGFPTVRVRYHDDIARIELPEARIGDFLVFNDRVNRQLQTLGFRYVTLDLGGFRSGRMNDTLTKQQIEAFA